MKPIHVYIILSISASCAFAADESNLFLPAFPEGTRESLSDVMPEDVEYPQHGLATDEARMQRLGVSISSHALPKEEQARLKSKRTAFPTVVQGDQAFILDPLQQQDQAQAEAALAELYPSGVSPSAWARFCKRCPRCCKKKAAQ